jgi:hypothetical protein
MQKQKSTVALSAPRIPVTETLGWHESCMLHAWGWVSSRLAVTRGCETDQLPALLRPVHWIGRCVVDMCSHTSRQGGCTHFQVMRISIGGRDVVGQCLGGWAEDVKVGTFAWVLVSAAEGSDALLTTGEPQLIRNINIVRQGVHEPAGLMSERGRRLLAPQM